MEKIVKTMLSRVKPNHYWFNYQYQVNLYSGCNFNCIYCDSMNNYYSNDNFQLIKPKKDALKILQLELSNNHYYGVIGMGAMCDPYNDLEKELLITPNFLKLAYIYDMGVFMLTKSDLVLRDIELYQKIAINNKVSIFMSISTCDDLLASQIEKNAHSPTRRFQALLKLNEANIKTGIVLGPLLPGINDNIENIISIVAKAAKVKTNIIWPIENFTLRGNQKEYFLNNIKDYSLELYNLYLQQYQRSYYIKSFRPSLKKAFIKECLKHNIMYQTNLINKELF
ncbi:MAG: radical SAM protein [Bacilli bacterium]